MTSPVRNRATVDILKVIEPLPGYRRAELSRLEAVRTSHNLYHDDISSMGPVSR